jgi:hypothetical protein
MPLLTQGSDDMDNPLKGYSLEFKRHYVVSGKVIETQIPFIPEDLWLAETVIKAIEKHDESNPGTDQVTGEKFWIDCINLFAVYNM